jgi:small subunit ribosomal protein S5
LINHTLPHQLIGEYGAGRVLGQAGFGRYGRNRRRRSACGHAGSGCSDVRTKVLGSTNPHNVVRATFDALLRMKDPMELARLRGKQV